MWGHCFNALPITCFLSLLSLFTLKSILKVMWSPKTSRFSFHFSCYISPKMLFPSFFPNVKSTRVRFGCHLAECQQESWTTWQLTSKSSLQIWSRGHLIPWLSQALDKTPFPFSYPLPMADATGYALGSITGQGPTSATLLRGLPWVMVQGCVADAPVYKKEALQSTLDEAAPCSISHTDYLKRWSIV